MCIYIYVYIIYIILGVYIYIVYVCFVSAMDRHPFMHINDLTFSHIIYPNLVVIHRSFSSSIAQVMDGATCMSKMGYLWI